MVLGFQFLQAVSIRRKGGGAGDIRGCPFVARCSYQIHAHKAAGRLGLRFTRLPFGAGDPSVLNTQHLSATLPLCILDHRFISGAILSYGIV